MSITGVIVVISGESNEPELVTLAISIFCFFVANTIRKRRTTAVEQNTKTVRRIPKEELETTQRQLEESLNIIENTVDPDVFFGRIDFMLKISDNKVFKNVYDSIHDEIDELHLEFLVRYFDSLDNKINSLKTDKAKQNNINKFYSKLDSYRGILSNDNISLFDDKVRTLIKNNGNLIMPVYNETIIKNTEPEITNHSIKTIDDLGFIPDEIKRLLWFSDGPFKNISKEDSYEVNIGNFRARIPLRSEPSAIAFSLPIESGIDNENIGYFPSYERLNPVQRYKYLTWLKDIRSPIDIGYVFIFYYGLERHLLFGDYINVAKAIVILQNFHDNSSFQSYSNDAIFISSIINKDVTFLDYVNTDKLSPKLLATYKTLYELPLTTNDIVRMSLVVGWTNNRYIKMYPELFNETLEEVMIDKYSTKEYEIDKELFLNTKKTFSLMLANYSIDYENRGIAVPDILSDTALKKDLHKILETTHETVKKKLAEGRKNKNIDVVDTK